MLLTQHAGAAHLRLEDLVTTAGRVKRSIVASICVSTPAASPTSTPTRQQPRKHTIHTMLSGQSSCMATSTSIQHQTPKHLETSFPGLLGHVLCNEGLSANSSQWRRTHAQFQQSNAHGASRCIGSNHAARGGQMKIVQNRASQHPMWHIHWQDMLERHSNAQTPASSCRSRWVLHEW